MKFKTIVITRKKLIFTFICAAATAAVGVLAAVVGTSSAAVETFKAGDAVYEDILSEGLPTEDTEKFSLGDLAQKLTGFDFGAPESIISQYSASFDSSLPQNNGEEPENESSETPPEPTPPPVSEPELPTKEQICSSVGLDINNATDYDVNLDAMCAEDLNFSVDDSGPQVLVVHTHTTECYDGDAMSGETERTTDDAKNVVAVGDAICQTLEEYGIKTYHDTTYHDYPSYQGAYTRTLTTITNRLAENPSVKMVLDVHRDAFIYSDGSKLKVSCEQNGVPTAKVMLVCGSDSMGLEHKNWRENLKLAAKIQNAAEIMYPGLMRPVNLRTERFNMHMSDGSLLIEVGSNGNTLDEAKAGGRDVARAIAAVLKNQ